jgi:signal transduction histidine kinase
MDETTRIRIFEPYFTTKPSGHGLGLAVVADLVQRAGGFIRVTSAPGEGTAMRVYLPRFA